MNELSKRLLSGTIYVILFLTSILVSSKTYMGLIAVFSIIAIFEFSKLIKIKNSIPYILLLLATLFTVRFYTNNNFKLILCCLTSFSCLAYIYSLYKQHDQNKKSIIVSLVSVLRYIILPFTFLFLLPFFGEKYVPELIIFIIVAIWSNDSFAYLTGKNFGKRKLFERISPKKTIEGFLGGLFFSIIIGCLFGYYSSQFSILNGIIIATLISVFGTYGDLVESMFKRIAKVKDSGNIMPGHGGILDRLDSLFFLAPFVYLYIHYII